MASELYQIAEDHPDIVIEYLIEEGCSPCEAQEILAGILYSDDFDTDDEDLEDCDDD